MIKKELDYLNAYEVAKVCALLNQIRELSDKEFEFYCDLFEVIVEAEKLLKIKIEIKANE